MQFDDSRENFVPEPHHGETSPSTFIYSWNKDICKVDKPEDLPRFSPSELIGRTFLYEMENGEKLRAEVARKLNDWDSQNHKNIKFLLKIGNSGVEEVMSYAEVCDRIEAMIEAEESGDTSIFTFKELIDHQGPLTS